MSSVPTQVTAELFAYLAERTTPEDTFLKELRDAALAAGLPPIWIAPEQAVFLQILLRVSGAKRVLELGTLAGYSAISMARALPADGHVDTVEIEANHADFARGWIAKAGEEQRITIHQMAALDLLPSLADNSYDAVFIDADKGNYAHYLKEGLRCLRDGGLMLVDNAFAFGRVLEEGTTTDDVWAIRAFNDFMAHEPHLQAIIVPIGDGCWVGVKQATA